MNAPAAPPAALAAFLRGVERRAAVLAELQCGDAATGDRALGAAMRGFRQDSAGVPMGEWPTRFWRGLLAQPGLRRHGGVAIEIEATDRLAALGPGPRAALLLRLAAGLDEPAAAAALGVSEASYRLALGQAAPRLASGGPDTQAWLQLQQRVHQRIKTLPEARQAHLAGLREAALAGDGITGTAPAAPEAQPLFRRRPRWLLPALWAGLALCVAAFAATWWWPDAGWRLPRPGAAASGILPEQPPAARYGEQTALLTHRDFALLADPQGMAAAADLEFHAWLAARAADAAPEAPAGTVPSPAEAGTGIDPSAGGGESEASDDLL